MLIKLVKSQSMLKKTNPIKHNRVYINIIDVIKTIESELLKEGNEDHKSFFSHFSEKQVIYTVILLFNDIIDNKVVLSSGIIDVNSSVLIDFLKSKGLKLLQAESVWWFIYDCVKVIVDQNHYNIIAGGVKVGHCYYLHSTHQTFKLE